MESMIRERPTEGASGLGILLLSLGVVVAAGVLLRNTEGAWVTGVGLAALVFAFFALRGLLMVNPNEGRVLQLFGEYVGTVREPGLRWVNPLYSRRSVSLRVRNFETQSRMKVNDVDGNPIEMSAVVVWRVVDTAQATFEVDNYERFVTVAAEAALRKLAMSYPYDAHDEEGKVSLRGSPNEIAEHLREEMQERLEVAGVKVLEARISNLSYAPEIAQAMLRRQQAGAVIAARQRIVEGSVGMVEMALARLSSKNIVNLDEERKAAMVSNLLVVLCSENHTQPIVNTGTLYP
jgi:regulator of protease activity HflC (stomatin/prohibitin superfamily)